MSVSGAQPRQIVLAASGVYSQYTASTGTGTAYVELTASTSAAIYITHVSRTSSSNYTGSPGNVIVATGAAASEIVIFTGWSTGPYGSTSGDTTVYELRYPVRVPSGTRLSGKVSAIDNGGSIIGVVYVAESAVI